MTIRKIRWNNKLMDVPESTLRTILQQHLKRHLDIRIHWGGTSESAELLEDGRIQALGRMGGWEWNEFTYYEDFETWFQKSVLHDEDNIDITLQMEVEKE